ncbi:MAG TPA: crotonase/enoyl-CoA hydratase family protein [Hellea balneolensis]|uniref:Crotonase/enoyl-CoA hydratase family protein n=1 Tax=Hellea balneolensis TaxID=287478 RepID=A0A7C3GKR7_9PROT|nr:crotonase/enoyl-CoA hydratase family protein [Hellea balneolensis]
MSDLVSYTLEDGVATIAMDDGKANVFSPAMLDALNTAFDKAEADKAVVIFTGNDRIFSGGFDLKIMMSGPEHAVALTCQGSRLARRILTFPTPVIGAADGHAIAMGAFFMLACDYRIGLKEGAKTGLNETQIGMIMHDFGIELAREFIAKTYLNRSLICGEIFKGEDAVKAGFIDTLVDKGHVLATAQATAKMMKLLSMNAFAGSKIKSRKDFLATLDAALAKDEKMKLALDGTA